MALNVPLVMQTRHKLRRPPAFNRVRRMSMPSCPVTEVKLTHYPNQSVWYTVRKRIWISALKCICNGTVYVLLLFSFTWYSNLYIYYGPETKFVPMYLLQPWGAQFVCRDSYYFWDSSFCPFAAVNADFSWIQPTLNPWKTGWNSFVFCLHFVRNSTSNENYSCRIHTTETDSVVARTPRS